MKDKYIKRNSCRRFNNACALIIMLVFLFSETVWCSLNSMSKSITRLQSLAVRHISSDLSYISDILLMILDMVVLIISCTVAKM